MLSGCHLPGSNLSSQQISLNTHPIKSYIWFSFRWVPWGAHAVILCKSHSLFTHVFLSFTWSHHLLLPLVRQRCWWPAAHPVLRGAEVPVSSAGVRMCCIGRVHSWRVSHHNGKSCSLTISFFYRPKNKVMWVGFSARFGWVTSLLQHNRHVAALCSALNTCLVFLLTDTESSCMNSAWCESYLVVLRVPALKMTSVFLCNCTGTLVRPTFYLFFPETPTVYFFFAEYVQRCGIHCA